MTQLAAEDPRIARFPSKAALRTTDASVAEGNSGTTLLAIPVTLSRPLSQPLTVCATAVPGSAWPGDPLKESDEKVTLVVAGIGDIRQTDPSATGTIKNDD